MISASGRPRAALTKRHHAVPGPEAASTALAMPARNFPRGVGRFLLCGLLVLPLLTSAAPSAARVTHLRCEGLRNPEGIDELQPRLSWHLESPRRGERQTALQIQIASSAAALKRNRPDRWDSGKMASSESVNFRYAGPPLTAGDVCHWRVRVWDAQGLPSGWSEPARWSMGLLSPADWQAKWIGQDGVETQETLTGPEWVWFPEEGEAEAFPPGHRFFRRTFILPFAPTVKHARLAVRADDEFALFINGRRLPGSSGPGSTGYDLTPLLRPGTNLLACSVRNAGEQPNIAGLLARLDVEFTEAEPLVLVTDASWKSSRTEIPGWSEVMFDDTHWPGVRVLGATGRPPWGEVPAPENRRLPARWLRQEFTAEKRIQRATVWMSGLGLSELYLNGQKVGDHVLSPALSDYDQLVYYVTHDVTPLLRRGRNAAGVVLGNGRYFAPRRHIPAPTRTFGFPKLLFQLRMDYTDGTHALVLSDESWQLTTEGPIRANNEYDGEEYDARREFPGWASPGFDACGWSNATLVAAPAGQLAAQMQDPIRRLLTLAPRTDSLPPSGPRIYDFGQNLVGTCRIRVSGPPGSLVTLRHAERLAAGGELYDLNLRAAKVTDTYILKGGGPETWEPRFTYHGFRYVQIITSSPAVKLHALEAQCLGDDVEPAGDFWSSDEHLNRLYRSVWWTVRGNYRSLPVDSLRDERQGWLGDRAVASRGETFLFNVQPLYRKWLRDMSNAQRPNGSLSDVCPAYWEFYSDNVTWPGVSVILPGMLREQYADAQIVARQYPVMRRWMDLMCGYLTDDLMLRDTYGDWVTPPERPDLIFAEDSARKTSGHLVATATFAHCLNLMTDYARQLGETADAARYADLAQRVKHAFNHRFLNPATGTYDNGTQSSSLLPLAFGLVPEEHLTAARDRLRQRIAQENHHPGVGLVGVQWLLRTLSAQGLSDLAWRMVQQRGYPSWGYMLENDATTIWELWNGWTADPAMNAGNQVTLVGDLPAWFYERLAGIRADPARPGFQHIIMQPDLPAGLNEVRAWHRSPHGIIRSEWQVRDGKFIWKITVPPNAEATAWIPNSQLENIMENRRRLADSAGVSLLREENHRAVVQLQAGDYQFVSPWKP